MAKTKSQIIADINDYIGNTCREDISRTISVRNLDCRAN